MEKLTVSSVVEGLSKINPKDQLSRSEVTNLTQDLGISVDAILGDREIIPVADLLDSIRGLQKDLEALPLGLGDRLPSSEKREAVKVAFENNETLSEIMDGLIERLELGGLSSVSELYNAFRSPDAASLVLIWSQLKAEPRIAAALDSIVRGIPQGSEAKDVKSLEEAEIQVRNKTFGHSFKGIDGTQDAQVLTRLVSSALSNAFSHALMRRVRKSPIPLLKGGVVLKDPEAFCKNLELSMSFEAMDFDTYLDTIATPLGQAQTKDNDSADAYFRDFEGMGEEIPASFGLVYLSEDQAKGLDVETSPTVRSFRYMGAPYVAVPVGLYLSKRSPEPYKKTLAQVEVLAETHSGTPVGEYYSSLAAYYRFGETSSNSGVSFQREYSEVCYKAERAWVRYVRYAAEHGLPTIHIHPFERYATRSTKSHDLALAIVNPEDTKPFLKAKADYISGSQAFLERSGVAKVHPAMAEKSLGHMENAALIALAARLHSAIKGAAAQNIPDEERGKEEGVVTLFDMIASVISNKNFRPKYLGDRDGVGGLAQWYSETSPEFLEYYMLFVGGHEMNHNMYKGKRKPVKGTGNGLSINMAEEVKASHGFSLMFKDSDRLKVDEIGRLRKVLPELIATLLVRLHPSYQKMHRSAPFLQEGAVLLDHAIKAGLLQVVRQGLTADAVEERPLEGKVKTGEFESIRVHLSDEAIQKFVSLCARFMERLAPIYYAAEFDPDFKDSTLPDLTEFDFLQAVTRVCYDKDSDPEGKEKVPLPADPHMEDVVAALLRFVDGEQPVQLKAALADKRGVGEEEMATALTLIQREILAAHPQITY